MIFFPILLNIEDKQILVVGGGNIALEKVKRLINFTKNITILSPEIKPELLNLVYGYNLNYICQKYEKGCIDNYDIVIVAVNDLNLQKEIYLESKSKSKLCNSVDMVKFSDFIFPSVVKKGDFILSFSTSGTSPALAKYLRQVFEKLIPEDIEKFLEDMRHLRESLPKGKERQELLDKLAKEFIEKHFQK